MTNQSKGQPLDRSGVQSVARAFDVLEALAEDGPMSLSQLAVAIDLPLTTVHRLIGSLTTLGYVVGDSTKQYSLAPRLMHLGERAGRMLSRWTLPELTAALDQARTSGYALDEGEQEVGVRCVAVAVTGATMPLAISVSGPAPRMTDDLVSRAVPALTSAAASLAAELGG
jgi:DNA-binding IclR family transcriptional regulator